jgi:hypothetical protein
MSCLSFCGDCRVCWSMRGRSRRRHGVGRRLSCRRRGLLFRRADGDGQVFVADGHRADSTPVTITVPALALTTTRACVWDCRFRRRGPGR